MTRPTHGYVVVNKYFEETWEESLELAKSAADNWRRNFPTDRTIRVETMQGKVVYRPTKKVLR